MTATTAEALAEGRDEQIVDLASQFSYAHLPEDLRPISEACHALAAQMIHDIPTDTPQLAVGLQKLLEAKDCFVRAKNRLVLIEQERSAREVADAGHERRKERIVDQTARIHRASPENPTGVELPRDAGMDE